MKTRFLGRTGVRVSALCFGTMSFGGDADEATSGALYTRCREAGINHFDTADVYQKGRSEEILGRLMATERDELVIATKAYFPMTADPNGRGTSRYHLVRAVEGSLRRLATDRVDILYLHRFDDATDLGETLRALELLVQQGKVLYPAVSNFAAWQVTKALGLQNASGQQPIACLQPMYNLVKRQAEVELLPMAQSESLGVFPYSPLGGGLLSGKYGIDRRPDSGRLTSNAMYQARYQDPDCYRIAEEFTELARELGHHPAALAVAWVGGHPGVTAPIIGARNLEQLEPVLSAPDIDMTPELRGRISAISPTPPPATDRNEETSSHNYGTR